MQRDTSPEAFLRRTNFGMVRAVFEIPASLPFVVGDIEINGRKIKYGAQIADFITMKLTGVASVSTNVHNAPIPCEGAGAVPHLAIAAAAPHHPRRGAL